ncbi:GGDEF domain-containing protein [Colwellia sp. M166]|uniref:GGDEF domain-containing protein n=1 Tax=Colwellia sp. M166 TaxID=2583805 RepID=UPI00211EF490|nr:GGDEF domain-containing protein [Colwellia sp. M166]|tara:strand:+ start:42873 stop:44138 length:1266 start_codon:yes stop_codon:yes gene_type:complete
MINKDWRLKSIIFYSVLIFFNRLAFADEILGQQQVFNKTDQLYVSQQVATEVLAINVEILSLKNLSEHDRVSAQVKLLKFQELDLTLNQAEQYILHLIRANIANIEGQEHKVVNWLNKAIKLEAFIAKKQLDEPLFASAYLTLASIYQRQGEAKKAFDSKEQYIRKYFAHLEQQKSLRVKRLSAKYDIEKRHEENELLSQNSKIKQYALAHAESERQQQNRNIAIFIAAAIVLFLLLLRQFKIRKALTLLAKTDSLTQLPNRRAFFDNGYIFMEHALRENKELSILMLDIDHFKNINDQFGHDIGDEVICNIAALAGETMRSRDFLARIGGEEFAAILPDANIAQARAIAERIREKIQDKSYQGQQDNIHITVSIGLASIKVVRESFDSLLHAADMAMYQAKANGRNQVCSYCTERKEKTD